MRVLISAYACNPTIGSEQAIGWNWVRQAARHHDVWVITRASNRDAIEAELAERPVPTLRFLYHGLPEWAERLQGGQGRRGERLYYLYWQRTALSCARELHAEVGFDLAHHITYGGIRYPTFLAWLGVPYILGPMGGGEHGPASFYPTFGLRGATWEVARDVSAKALAIPVIRRGFREARLILTTSEQTRKTLAPWAREKALVETAIGIDAGEGVGPRPAPEARDDGRFAALYVGRLIPWKGVRFAVSAFARFRREHGNAKLTLVGSGPDRRRLEALAREQGVAQDVEFLGEVPYEGISELYRQHDVFLFPCFHLGGIAVLEAMRAGLPVVTLDLPDISQEVTHETGVKVPVRSPDQLVAGLARALERLADDAGLRRRMGDAGLARVREVYDWDRRGDAIARIYEMAAAGATVPAGR